MLVLIVVTFFYEPDCLGNQALYSHLTELYKHSQ